MKTQTISRQNGIALLTVMFILVLATTLSVAMVRELNLGIKRIDYTRENGQVYFYALGVESWALGRLKKDRQTDTTNGKMDHLKEQWNQKIKLQIVDKNAKVSGQISDLQAKFNINNLRAETDVKPPPVNSDKAKKQPTPPPPKTDPAPGSEKPTASAKKKPPKPKLKKTSRAQLEYLTRILNKLDIPTNLAYAIADWVDSDKVVRFPGGAEDTDYLSLNPPHRAPNNQIASITELRMIKGMKEKYYNKLKPYIIALPTATKVNVNTAPAVLLQSLSPSFDAQTASNIIEYRGNKPFKSPKEFMLYIKTITGKKEVAPREMENLISVSSEYFSSHATIIMKQARIDLISLLLRNQVSTRVIRRGLRAL